MNETGESHNSKQFLEKRLEKNYGRGTVAVLRVTPNETDKNTDTTEETFPVFFAQGYGGDKTLPWYLKAFAKNGREAVSIGFSGKRRSNSTQYIQKEGLSVKVPILESDKADDIISSLDELGIEQTDLVAESAGALRALIAVAEHPERFRHVVLVHPAGLDDTGLVMTHGHVVHHQIRSVMEPRLLSERLSRKEKRLESADDQLDISNKGLGWIRAEQKAVAKSRFHELLPELKRKHPHLQITIVADINDYNFRPKKLEKINGRNVFEFITSKWNGHGIGQKQERIDEIASILKHMNTKQQKGSVTSLHQRSVEEPIAKAA